LDLTARFVQSGLGGTQTIRDGFGPNAPVIAVIPGGVADAFANLLKLQNKGFSAGVSMQIPLKQSVAAGRIRPGHHGEKDGRREHQGNRSADRPRGAKCDHSRRNEQGSHRNRTGVAGFAGAAICGEQRRFELGASTVRFVLEEQDNLQRLQTNEIAALVNYRKALVDYDHALGVTLKKNNVNIEKAIAALK
jgi:hypothetical protein